MIPPSRSPRSDSERAEGSVARRTSPQSRSQPAQHVCFCGKSYVRKEHLRRHQAIHDGMQQHTCTLCGAKFARKYVDRRRIDRC
ncbi:hypothetical protein BKA56DRAFT_605900 [Ilyonectria sp. MPI-CAGE-AT-0026]|nr:hypothetical protein BKA56DRAFT_605900 [Ilyonectria sp. MPI-CAGE-AT-0026]